MHEGYLIPELHPLAVDQQERSWWKWQNGCQDGRVVFFLDEGIGIHGLLGGIAMLAQDDSCHVLGGSLVDCGKDAHLPAGTQTTNATGM